MDNATAGDYFKLGLSLHRRGRLNEAISNYHSALQLDPNYVDAYFHLGVCLRQQGNLDEAIRYYRQTLNLDPDRAEAWNSLGNALFDRDMYDEAIRSYQKAIQLKPDHADACTSLGLALYRQNKLKEAFVCLQRAIAIRPSFPEAHLNLSYVLLQAGDLKRGFAEFEWMWQLKDFPPRNFSQPLWDGLSLDGGTLLLHAAGGFGDTIQFVRYLPLVQQHVNRIIVECQSELVRLLRGITSIDRVLAKGEQLPDFQAHAPLISLPYLLGTTLETIPAEVPYLFSDRRSAVSDRLKESDTLSRLKTDNLFKVGIVWASGYRQGTRLTNFYKRKSCPLSAFDRILPNPNLSVYSLQVGQDAGDIERCSYQDRLQDLRGQIRDFADTAAFIEQLDLVICVDTAVAHLAGAMGKPVWVLLPFAADWRWMLDREDSPWYPTMRLFRQQNAGDWETVMVKVVKALESFLT